MTLNIQDVLSWHQEPNYLEDIDKIPAKAFGRVALLYGGVGSEREVSLSSGQAVFEALKQNNIDVTLVDSAKDLVSTLINGRFDRAFNILHGPVGEDGTIHGLLSMLNIPCTGSDLASSALCMDKVRSKMVWQSLGLSTPAYGVADTPARAQSIKKQLGFPLVVKPIDQGSSVHTFVNITTESEYEAAVTLVQTHYGRALIEQYIPGEDYFVGIVGQCVLPSVRVETDCEFYNYEAKYLVDDNRYIAPGTKRLIDEETLAQLCHVAYAALGCRGWGRMDCRRDTQGRFWLLEANTIPGMTPHSLFPTAARALGIDFATLVKAILSQTLHETKTSEDSSPAVAS